MGTAKTVAQFSRNVGELGDRIAAPNKRASLDAASVYGEIIDREADRAGATSWAGKPRPTYKVRNKVSRNGDVVIRPARVGPVVALNEGTGRHFIGAGARARAVRNAGLAAARNAGLASGGRRVRSGSAGALHWAGARHPVDFVSHPGMRGFRFIPKANKVAPEKAAEVWLKAKRRELRKAGG